jgi:hypothetical protein
MLEIAIKFMAISFIVVWILGALLTLKIEAMFMNEPTWKKDKPEIIVNLCLSLSLWPIVAIMAIMCRHEVDWYSEHGNCIFRSKSWIKDVKYDQFVESKFPDPELKFWRY